MPTDDCVSSYASFWLPEPTDTAVSVEPPTGDAYQDFAHHADE